MNKLPTNRVLQMDSYKSSHPAMYPAGIRGMFSYIEARSKTNTTIIPYGLQMWIKKTLLDPITKEEIDEAEAFLPVHGLPFDRKPWDKILNEYNGFLPIKIRSVTEGLPVKESIPLVTVECLDKDLFWLVSWIETSLQRGVWYPTTIATRDHENWKLLKRFHNDTCDNLDSLPFSMHCFGGRGVSSSETAEIGGSAHLIHFLGSDTVEGIRAANWYYNCGMSGFSIPASEHSVQITYGKLFQKDYIGNILKAYAKNGKLVSIVLDGYDVFRESETVCTEFKDIIIASGAKVVFRPDSGDPLDIVLRILKLQAATFGFKMNNKGYKEINNVGVIQGDGVDLELMNKLLIQITDAGFAANNLAFGSGGNLLQKVNRDTFKFAMKVSAYLKGDKWIGCSKDPITDPGKASKEGRITTTKWKMTGEIGYANIDNKLSSEFEDIMITIYDGKGVLFNETSLDDIRELAMKP